MSSTGDPLDPGATRGPAGDLGRSSPPPSTAARRLGDRYELLSEIGRGGFGVVYRGRQLATGQPVAIKMLHRRDGRAGKAAAQMAERFRREMQLCAQLHHPNIVRLLDFSETDDGQMYTVFELVQGKNLAEVLAAEGPLPPDEARHLMLQVLDGLSSAHALGIVHRDLKPANIMTVATGARRNALVLDFGIGALAQPGGGDARLTGNNEWVGTPLYVAPEQLRGYPPSPGADLYAWGLVFVECLTGAAAMRAGSAGEAIRQQLDGTPVPLPLALRQHPLGAILARVLAKSTAARDTDERQLFARVESCDLAGLPRGLGVSAPAPVDTATTWGPDEATCTMDGAAVTVNARAPLAAPATQHEAGTLTAVCCALAIVHGGDAAPDVEEVDRLQQAQRAICARVAARHGGLVAGGLADQVLLYFGGADARGDGADRAAQAALEIVAAVREAGARGEGRRASIEVRVGVHSGPVLAAAATVGGSRVLGSTPRTAARLCALSPPGVIAVSPDTHRLLAGRFRCEPLGDGGTFALRES